MEKKVIKFNLIGAILIFVLVVAIIVGLIIGISKLINKTDDKNGNNVQNQKQVEEIDESKEYKEKIKLRNGEERESRLRYFKSSLGYIMKFDCDLFYAEKTAIGTDQYYSLYSNKVGILIEKKEGEFEKLEDELQKEGNEIMESVKDLYSNKQCTVNVTNINGVKTFVRTMVSKESTEQVYCVKINDNSYYKISVMCSDTFENELLPVMEHMINSFEIINS